MRGARSAKWVAGAIGVALAATACGGGDGGDNGNGGSGEGGGSASAVFSIDAGEPQNPLIPTDTNEQYGALVIDNVFANLVDFDEEGGLVYTAAESIEANEDATEWTITLRDGWTFHDGEAVTAESYVNAWNWAAHLSNNQKNSYWFGDIEGYDEVHPEEGDATAEEMSGLEVVDELTFTVTLSSPVSYFNYKLGYNPFTPLPSSFYDDPQAFGQEPIGNGAYKFASWERDSKITLEAYEDYRGDNKPQNDGVELVNYNNLNAAYNDLLSGSLDILRQVDTQNLPVFQDDLGDRAISQPYMANQTLVPVFYSETWEDTDPRVLQGLSMAIDRETIVSTVLNNSVTVATGFVAPGAMGFQENSGGEIMEFNPERANELIEEGGGVPGNEITIQYNADGGHEAWVTAVCNSIRQNTGVECTGDAKPDFQTDLNARDAKEVDSMYRGGWIADYPLNVSFMKELYGTGSSANTGFFSNEEVDALFAEGDAAASVEETVAAYQEAEKALFEHMPAIPLWHQGVNGGFSENVENVRFDVTGQPVLTEVTVK
ncbi:ABC transporter substrate-binding protein [Streptomyces alkaliphilus]|uniref:ABC transporter substrate-binding protein n=1 Tax=Streptomyces alkaliphilus TaxID=1472722 RepID=A0A7W3TA36_9ACTN|nr:ABC transporter substrate-binding protein [Streptomyces alkaliphilus]MBB0243044.1 ABC transporter substrate-binding protein [Streptomyces alkaliphilus]